MNTSWFRRCTTAALLCGLSLPAFAQNGGFDVQTFNPATDPGLDYLRQFSARPFDGPRFGFGFIANYARNPLVVRRDGERVGALVSDLLTADVQASVAFAKRFRIGLDLPVVLWQAGDDAIDGFGDEGLLEGSVSLGDLRVIPQVNLFSQETKDDPTGFSLGLAVDLRLPTGSKDAYSGEGWRLEPRLLADYAFSGWALGANVGYVVRDAAALRNVEVDDVLAVGLSADIPVSETVELVPEVNTQLPVAAETFDSEESPVEVLLGVHWFATDALAITGGAGLGVVQGVGSPDFRVFLGLHGIFAKNDRDGDGLIDGEDQCPDEPEDKDGFEDGNGCPDVDNDQDGILDVDDKCRDEAEDKDGFSDADGCPDVDNDKDGIPDANDTCPLVAEDKDDHDDADGCPDPDNDLDGVLDTADKCPMEPEDKDEFEDADGCPDPDNDQDGILDAADKCPIDPENKNGFEDDDGCPDKQRIVVTCEKLVIADKIYFQTGKANIKKSSYGLLDEVVEVLKKYPDIAKMRIEGHTDSRGSEASNLKLSDSRVDSVRTYMVEHGIAGDRLVSQGFGESKPIDSNRTRQGRANNRRVEFMILERKGCSKAAAASE